jgi:hypothetical protein
MMGQTKLNAIRTELRKAFGMSDRKLFAWFNQQIKVMEQKPKNPIEMQTLQLLRDALTNEPKEKRTSRKRVSSRTKR